MQTRFFINVAAGLALLVTVVGCSRKVAVRQPTSTSSKSVRILTPSSTQGLPPGQAKKVYGHQSAKAFAPGQQKKNNTTVVVVQGKETGNNKKSGKKKK